jgi:VWFA-related protein
MVRPAVAVFLAALLTWGQTPRPEIPSIRVSTHVVEVNVIVRDRSGPVADLVKSDFRVLENGKEKPIAFFSVNSVHKAKSQATSAPASGPTTSGQPPTSPLSGHVFTNHSSSDTPPGSVTVVLMDALNTTIQDQNYAKQQFVSFLRQIQPEDRVAVYALGARLRVLQDFTNDSTRLVAALSRFHGENLPTLEDSTPDPANTEDADIDRWLNDRNALIADLNIASRVRTTVYALEAIANHIGRVPGRKNLIWITGSFPFSIGQHGTEASTNWNDVLPNPKGPMASGTTKKSAGLGDSDAYAVYGSDLPGDKPSRESFAAFDKEISRATRALNNAGIAIYPVDARGLVTMPKIFTAQGGPISRSSVRQTPIPLAIAPTGIDAMKTMAESTGGRAFYNSNDIQSAIRSALDDSEVTYTLAYYLDSKELDSKFHQLKVEVKRKNVEARYRKGYFAIPDPPAGDEQRDAEIDDALIAPLDATGIEISGTVERVQKPRPSALRVTLSIQPRDIALLAVEKQRTGSLNVIFGLRSATGADLGTVRQTMSLKLDEAQYREMSGGLVVTKTLDAPADVSQLRIVLCDRNSGRLGSLTMTVK